MASRSVENHVKIAHTRGAQEFYMIDTEREMESSTETESSSGYKPKDPIATLSVRVVGCTNR
jgi:hypothetical protein